MVHDGSVDDLTALDMLLLRCEEVRDLLAGHGLVVPRVIGWAGTGLDLPGPAEVAAELSGTTDLTAGDLARLDRELGELVGHEVVVVIQRAGEATVLPGEKVRYL